MKRFRGVMGSAAIYALANAVNSSIPFLLIPVMTRTLSPAEYGTVTLFTMIISILGAFTGLSVHGAVSARYYRCSPQELASYIGNCFGILAVSTLVVVTVIGLFHGWLEQMTGLPGDWLIIAALASGAQFAINIRLALWQVKSRPVLYGGLQIGQSLINGLLSLVLILGIHLGWQGRAIGQVVATGLIMLVAIYSLWRRNEVSWPAGKHDARDALRFGLPLIPHTLAGLAIATIDRFYVDSMLGKAMLGHYTVAYQLGMILGMLADAYSKAYCPWLYRRLQDGSAGSLSRIVKASHVAWVGFLVFALIIWCGMKAIAPLLLGPAFTQAADLSIWFLLGNAFLGMYYSISGLYFFSGKTAYITLVTVFTCIIAASTTPVFINFWGVTGGAISFAITNATTFIIAISLSGRAYSIPWLNIHLRQRRMEQPQQ
ncbi:oligosaccharide flippase family protein [Neisseriaceae bacterium JH1-16]|nr:oligosaccharide flippase family protein [Neisseriaceae bacterium JH1-16]